MNRRTAITLFLTVVLAGSLAYSQTRPAVSGDKGPQNYDKAAETRVRGTVEDVTQPPSARNRWVTMHLTLKSDEGTFDVHVAPSAYLSFKQFSLSKGDAIEVVGSKVKIGGRTALLARQITKDGKVLTLRNEQGFPVWAARRERQQSHDHEHDD